MVATVFLVGDLRLILYVLLARRSSLAIMKRKYEKEPTSDVREIGTVD